MDNEINQREIDVFEFYLKSIEGITGKMQPADFLYLSDRIWDIQERLIEIRKR